MPERREGWKGGKSGGVGEGMVPAVCVGVWGTQQFKDFPNFFHCKLLPYWIKVNLLCNSFPPTPPLLSHPFPSHPSLPILPSHLSHLSPPTPPCPRATSLGICVCISFSYKERNFITTEIKDWFFWDEVATNFLGEKFNHSSDCQEQMFSAVSWRMKAKTSKHNAWDRLLLYKTI